MRTTLLSILFTLFGLVAIARAQSYQDKKDADAIATIQRALGGVDKVPALFDGTKIPPGAELRAVDELGHKIGMQLKIAASGFNSLSGKAAARTDVQALRAKFDELTRYRQALIPALSAAERAADAAARQQAADNRAAVEAAGKTCKAFRDEIERTHDGSTIGAALGISRGQDQFWQTLEDGARFKSALERLSALCKRPEFADVGAACIKVTSAGRPLEADYCTLPAKAGEIMKQGVQNLIAFHVKNTGPARITKQLEADLGWLDADGVPTWASMTTGKALRAQLEARIAPLMAQAGMNATDADALWNKLAGEYSELEAKIRELAPRWDVPGQPCAGAGCSQARSFLGQWYRGDAILRFQHTQPGWKILKNDLGIPTYRERYGYALIRVPGEPLCQLRGWILSESYAGGGRYAAARDITLGHVRWQACK